MTGDKERVYERRACDREEGKGELAILAKERAYERRACDTREENGLSRENL